MRTGLQEVDGVQDAQVSLEKGVATLQLKSQNNVTLEKLQQVIRENGFTPKNAHISLIGRISGNAPEYTVHPARSNQTYRAKLANKLKHDQVIRNEDALIEADVSLDTERPLEMMVQSITTQPQAKKD